MDPLSFSTDYSLEDWRALNAAARARLSAMGSFWQRTLRRIPMFLLVALMVAGATWLQHPNAQAAWVFGIGTSLLLCVVQGLLTLRQYRPRRDGQFLGPTRIEIDAGGLHITRRHSEGQVRWSQIIAIDVTPAYVFLWCDTIQAHVLPGRDLPPPLTTQTAAERIRAFMAASPAASTLPVAAEAPATNAETATALPGGNANEPPRTSVGQELIALLRLLLVRPIDGARIAGRDLTICILSVILLALWIPLDPLLYSDQLEFSPYDFPGLVWIVAGALALAWILARLSRPPVAYRRTLLLVLGALPIAMIGSGANGLTDDRWVYLVIAGASIVALSYFKRGLRAITGTNQIRALLVGAAATFGFVMLSDALYVNPSLWQYSDEDADEETEDSATADRDTWARMEELQFGQQARIDTAIAAIRAARQSSPQASIPQVYFLGFAGVGEQRVFAGEIALAAQRVGQRYQAAQRSLLLVNDRRDPEKLPLATVPGLRHALHELGGVMGPEDVLFLALSSHGSEDVTLQVSNLGMTSPGLSAAELADMLRESHIRWKVIVISACYAGGFIDTLRDDHTIVLAAAAPDRTSFGCADDRDLTYFGEAFYRDALPRAASLRAAFEAARTAIGKREKQEHFDASDPQAYFGALLETKLGAMEVALAPAPPH